MCLQPRSKEVGGCVVPPPDAVPLPALTLIERDADDYLRDHEFHRQQAGFMSDGPVIDAVPEAPTVPTMLRLPQNFTVARVLP